MKKIIILLCIFSIALIGCAKTKEVDIQKDVSVKTEGNKYEIRDNYLESIQKQFPDDLYIAGLDLENEAHNAQFGVDYQGNKEKTMIKMAEIFKVSEDFLKFKRLSMCILKQWMIK